ncbi:MAG TPA: hypothetical protein PLT92_11660 [Ignavibacteriaceae bacterium]|nr:hypothetical protein [Ignavibacteriaceae bacterium]
MTNTLRLFKFTLFLCLLFVGNMYGQVPTYSVYPYTDKVLPEEPLVYYPTTGITFGPSNISIKDEQGKTPDENEVKIVYARPFYNSRFNTTTSFGMGYPASCVARILFKKPGKTYTISFRPSVSCANCANADGSYPGDRKILGNNEFKVQVMYPRMAIPINLEEFYVIGTKLAVNFAAVGLEDHPNPDSTYYSYEFTFKDKTEEKKGSQVVLDDIFADPDNRDMVFTITGKYRGEIIQYSPTEKAQWSSKLRFNPENLIVKHTWSDSKNNPKELSLSDDSNFEIKFRYEDELPNGSMFVFPMQGIASVGARIELNEKPFIYDTRQSAKEFVLIVDKKAIASQLGKLCTLKLQFTDTFGKTVNKDLFAIFKQ